MTNKRAICTLFLIFGHPVAAHSGEPLEPVKFRDVVHARFEMSSSAETKRFTGQKSRQVSSNITIDIAAVEKAKGAHHTLVINTLPREGAKNKKDLALSERIAILKEQSEGSLLEKRIVSLEFHTKTGLPQIVGLEKLNSLELLNFKNWAKAFPDFMLGQTINIIDSQESKKFTAEQLAELKPKLRTKFKSVSQLALRQYTKEKKLDNYYFKAIRGLFALPQSAISTEIETSDATPLYRGGLNWTEKKSFYKSKPDQEKVAVTSLLYEPGQNATTISKTRFATMYCSYQYLSEQNFPVCIKCEESESFLAARNNHAISKVKRKFNYALTQLSLKNGFRYNQQDALKSCSD